MTTEKRLLLAAALSLGVLLLWTKLFPEPKPAALPRQAQTAGAAAPSSSSSIAPASEVAAAPAQAPSLSSSIPAPAAATQETLTTVENELLRATFSNRGGVLTSLVLLKYKDAEGRPLELVRALPPEAPRPFALDFGVDAEATRRVGKALFVVEKEAAGAVRLRFADAGVGVEKRIRLGADYLFDVQVAVAGPACRLFVGPGLRNTTERERASSYVQPPTAIASVGGSIDRMYADKAEKLSTAAGKEGRESAPWPIAPGGFAGIEDNYFLAVLAPKSAAAAHVVPFVHMDEAGKPQIEVGVALAVPAEGQMKAYFGPKELDILARQGLGLERTVDFGAAVPVVGAIFDAVARPLLWLLKKTYARVHNYGWSIIIVTLLIRILIFPLVHKSYASMKKMQTLAPKMKAIKDKYKGKTTIEQRNKMNQELMALYQAEGYNPMSGCFPVLLQMPVFIGFYNVLRSAIELRQAPWILWVHDLSAVDSTYVLVILMVVTMFIQQALTPASVDPMQKRIFMALPFIWGFFLKDMPSGLVLYWLFSNVLTILQQLLIKRMGAKDEPPKGARARKARPERVAT
ncbi:MAG: membrane protein insertase YidC [Thermoanaerobaculia bacterium]